MTDFDALLAAFGLVAVLCTALALAGVLKVELKRQPPARPRRPSSKKKPAQGTDPWEPEPPF